MKLFAVFNGLNIVGKNLLLFISRWDIQHMRAIQAHQNLEKKSRDREEARLKGKRTGCKSDCEKSVESFLPCPEEGMLRLS